MVVVDLVLKNAKIKTSSQIIDAGIAVDNEKIVSITKSTLLPSADLTIDVKGNIVCPGMIDTYGHLHDPETRILCVS